MIQGNMGSPFPMFLILIIMTRTGMVYGLSYQFFPVTITINIFLKGYIMSSTHLIAPHGGTLVNLLVDEQRRNEIKTEMRDTLSWVLTPRQTCDIELLINGAFSPLSGFMKKKDYDSICDTMRLADGSFWPIPVILDVPEEFASPLKSGSNLALRDQEGVLVAIMNRRRDFRIARDEGWYRIPVQHAPESTTEAAVLAFYFARAFGDDKWSIRWYAPVRGHELVSRRQLLSLEPKHPRADRRYYKMQLGPLMELEQPILSLRWRRVTFIETSWDRFAAAEEINDLYASGADGLYVTLKEAGINPEREFLIRERGMPYRVDLAVPCEKGTVAIVLGDRPGPSHALRDPDSTTVLHAADKLGGPLVKQRR